jgi:hypothetical protein
MSVSLAEIESTLRSNVELQKQYLSLSSSPVWQGVFNRAPIYTAAAQLSQALYIWTGGLDIQTRPEEALKLKDVCQLTGKLNCNVHILPGLGHGMSQPRGPRRQKLLDATLGPVDEAFLKALEQTARQL